MGEGFKVIETQEQFDEAIKERLNRANAKYQATMDELKAKITEYDEMKAKLAEYEAKMATVDADAEKRVSRIAELEKAISERDAKINGMTLDAARIKAVHAFGLPDEMANRLAGATAEEISEDAEKLSKVFAAAAPKAPSYNSESTQTDSKDAALKEMLKNLTF